jgi:hypothetical protein
MTGYSSPFTVCTRGAHSTVETEWVYELCNLHDPLLAASVTTLLSKAFAVLGLDLLADHARSPFTTRTSSFGETSLHIITLRGLLVSPRHMDP